MEEQGAGAGTLVASRGACCRALQEQTAGRHGRRLLHRQHRHGVGGVQAEDADGGVYAAHGQEAGALAGGRQGAHVHGRHLALHLLLLHLRQLPHRVQLEVVQLTARQSNRHLSLVGGGADDAASARHPPLVHTLVRLDMTEPARVDLQHGVISHELTGQGGNIAQEAAVVDLLHRLPDGQHQSGICEGHHNQSVQLISLAALERPHRGGLPGQLPHGELGDGQPGAQDAQAAAGAAPAHGVDLRDLLRQQVGRLHVHDGAERLHFIHHQQVLQPPRVEEHGAVPLLRGHRVGTAALHVRLLTDSGELVQRVVAELGGGKQEAGLQHANGGTRRQRVEVLHFHFRHHLLVIHQRHLVDVSVLALQQKEEPLPGLVCGKANNEHSPVPRQAGSPRDDSSNLIVVLVPVDDEVVSSNEHTAGPITAARHRHQQVSAVVDGLAPLSQHVVQPQIQLVVRQVLLRLTGCLARWVQVCI
mmetsp:Transcript_7751/g.22947  ORF Transcript_7751/g.22947 Transcript_7751/m.22947 type:complete len:474 (+) Transcript_7751:2029-3450(+)